MAREPKQRAPVYAFQESITDLLRTRNLELRDEVGSEDRDALLNLNEAQYASYLVSRYTIEPLVVDWDGMEIGDRQVMIPASEHPSRFHLIPERSYSRQVLTFSFPTSGNVELARCKPSTMTWNGDPVSITESAISFDLINFWGDLTALKPEIEEYRDGIRTMVNLLSEEVRRHNSGLKHAAHELVRSRKNELLKQQNLLASLGVRLPKKADVPETFSVPFTRKALIVRSGLAVEKPKVPGGRFAPEPTLEDASYGDILRLFADIGREMERLPSIRLGKGEEPLRDLFILVLSPHFQSVTGETFNAKGKTDILVRHEGANLFVAECKFWKGAKGYQETIDQLLSYLTWRDSKTAILLFVRNREFQPVLDQLAAETAKHPNFVQDHGKEGENQFRFEFHLPDNQHRRVWLTVLCFHFPEA